MKQSIVKHIFQNASLLCLGLCLAPLTTAVILAVSIYNILSPLKDGLEPHAPSKKRILVTGVSMSKGLELARLFHQQGHVVIGADVDGWACGRVSRAVGTFYRLPPPPPPAAASDLTVETSEYAKALLRIVEAEDIDLWVSVSGVDSALQDSAAKHVIERRTKARAIQFDSQKVRMLDDKGSFIDHVQNLGLKVPDSRRIDSKHELLSFLRSRGSLACKSDTTTRYLIKPVGVNDAARLDMPLLPLSTERETLARINLLNFDKVSSFIAQEFIQGDEYCTYSLVVRGRVTAFVACQSADVLMHYVALPQNSTLSESMRRFTVAVAEHAGESFTGHLSFDFMAKPCKEAKGSAGKAGEQLYPIECNPRVHTAVVLFRDTRQLVDRYLSVLEPDANQVDDVLYPQHAQRYYWVGQDLVEKVFCPVYRLLCGGTASINHVVLQLALFVEHVLYWKEGTFVVWDPWPFWWLYHVQWPARLINCLVRGKRWERANVSTGKMFQVS